VVVTAERLGSTTTVAHDFERTPCRIIISDRTLALLGDRFETQPVGVLALKGKEKAVEAHRVLRARDPL
jgi:class 3 adenylate cyclase